MVGFLLSSGYRSVLLSTLVSPLYEKPIDTIQDLLDTDRPIFSSHPSFLLMMKVSALKSLRDLGTKIENAIATNATEISMRWDLILYEYPKRLTKVFFYRENRNDVVTIAITERRHTETYFNYQGKELLFSWGQTFLLPKSSPLKVYFGNKVKYYKGI